MRFKLTGIVKSSDEIFKCIQYVFNYISKKLRTSTRKNILVFSSLGSEVQY